MAATLTGVPLFRVEPNVAKRPIDDRPHGASVRVYEKTHRALGHVAEWFSVSRMALMDVLILDRLKKLSRLTGPALEALWENPDVAQQTFEELVQDLFKVKTGPPVSRVSEGQDKLASTSMRINQQTHQVVAVLAEFYDRFIPYVYSTLIDDRLGALHGRVTDIFQGRKPRVDFRTAVKETLGFDVPKEVLDAEGEVGARRKFPQPQPKKRSNS